MNELKYPFPISILPIEESEGYLIVFPDLPRCMSDGVTIEKTIENRKHAVACWIETAKRYRNEIPEPSLTARPSLQQKLTLVTLIKTKLL